MGSDASVADLLRKAVEDLRGKTETPRLDAELILAHLLSCSKINLITNQDRKVRNDVAEKFFSLIGRRVKKEPIAYLINQKEFFSLDFYVNEDVLIPRPETEIIVEEILRISQKYKDSNISIIDCGTGSGCIAISIADTLRKCGTDFSVLALDHSEKSLQIAKLNAKKNNVEEYITFICSDWLNSIAADEKFDFIVANPPYIDRGDTGIAPQILFEPHSALFSGKNGTADIEQLIPQAANLLHKDGCFLCEIGETQGMMVLELATSYFAQIDLIKDLSGKDRVLRGWR